MTVFSIRLLGAAAALALISAPAAFAQDNDAIDYGDDTSTWANDGECDDPRFEGEGMASGLERVNLLKDATDCRTLLEEGKISFSNTQYDPNAQVVNGTDLGDNSYEFANDDQCDDARFIGAGMAVSPSRDAIMRDRDDCSYGFQLGELTLASELPDPVETTYDDIDFGHDKGGYPGDGECDDPRFSGTGMATISLENGNIGGDRKDCLAAYKAGDIVLKERFVIDGFFFGDDQNLYPNDGECDDPRFEGSAMAAKPTLSGVAHDATDCMAAWRASTIRPVGRLEAGGILIANGLVFGDDTSSYANDGECDDPSFSGSGMASSGGSAEHAGHDRTDCQSAFERGTIKPAPVVPVVQSIRVDGITFGDDSGAFSNDGECDDPRFEGSAMASILRDEDMMSDATDCLTAYQNGAITLKQ